MPMKPTKSLCKYIAVAHALNTVDSSKMPVTRSEPTKMHTTELPAFVYAKPILLPRISRRRDQSPSFSAKWFIATEWDLSVSCVMSLKIETTRMRRL